MRCSTSELTAHLGGELIGPDVSVEGASIDSRTLCPGQLYVPIVAERDGHAFIPAALDAGAPAYLTAQDPVGGDGHQGRRHIGGTDASRCVRARRGWPAVSSASRDRWARPRPKTSLPAASRRAFVTAASERSFNNELGLPLTLLNAPDDAQWVVLEMGARGAGHIERLAQVARPDVGIVTSVAMAHIEYFGDLDGVARAKSELVAALPASGRRRLELRRPTSAGDGLGEPLSRARLRGGCRCGGAGRRRDARRRAAGRASC